VVVRSINCSRMSLARDINGVMRRVVSQESGRDGRRKEGVMIDKEPRVRRLPAYESKNPVVQAQCVPDSQDRYEECSRGRNYWLCEYPKCKILRGTVNAGPVNNAAL
jgi:hypothetical protein